MLRRGFGELAAGEERTRIGLSNSLGPQPPGGIGDDDLDVVREYDAILGPALAWLERSGLITSTVKGRDQLRFYRLTERGRLALADGGADLIVPESP